MTETIKVTISPEGDTTIAVEGVVGRSCTDLTKDLEKALGSPLSSRKTADYHKLPQQKVKHGRY